MTNTQYLHIVAATTSRGRGGQRGHGGQQKQPAGGKGKKKQSDSDESIGKHKMMPNGIM